MSTPAKRIRLTVIILLAIAALGSGIFVSQHMHSTKTVDVSQFHGTYLEKPRVIHDFALKSTENQAFNNQSLKGQWTLVFFGFTSCGSVCPTTMAELAKMYRLLEEKGISPLPHVVMISLDPHRDTMNKLRSYVTSFQSAFSGARGKASTIEAMTQEMGIAYIKASDPQNPKSKDYNIEHTGTIMLFNPQGELNAFFTTPHHAEELAADYKLLLS